MLSGTKPANAPEVRVYFDDFVSERTLADAAPESTELASCGAAPITHVLT